MQVKDIFVQERETILVIYINGSKMGWRLGTDYIAHKGNIIVEKSWRDLKMNYLFYAEI